jgi:pimeloyl-ACP methyl ester carboxylesterase/DNA-binding CsgD family transcriptional regulator
VDQEIRFCSTGEGRVAYALAGEGPPLVLGGWWVSHLELDWGRPSFRRFVEALAARRTVVRYDPPGSGLSDRTAAARPLELDRELGVLEAVLDAAGLERAAMLGISSGGCVAAAVAARRPDRVEALVLYGSYRFGEEIAPPEVRQAILTAVSSHWGLGSRLLADVFMPGASASDREEFARFQREAASTEAARTHLEFVYSVDVRAELEAIDAPVLVLHRRDDRAIPYELGRDVAAAIPGARLLTLTGSQHLPWLEDAAGVTGAVGEFLDGRAAIPRPEAGPAELSERELEVLRLVAGGMSDSEIANRLVLSPHTIHRHVANIRTKLRQPSRAAAVAHASRIGLI